MVVVVLRGAVEAGAAGVVTGGVGSTKCFVVIFLRVVVGGGACTHEHPLQSHDCCSSSGQVNSAAKSSQLMAAALHVLGHAPGVVSIVKMIWVVGGGARGVVLATLGRVVPTGGLQ